VRVLGFRDSDDKHDLVVGSDDVLVHAIGLRVDGASPVIILLRRRVRVLLALALALDDLVIR
jgi:hypothetical protein